MDEEPIKEFMIRIVDMRDFVAPGKNLKVRTTDSESAASLAHDAYKDMTGIDTGEPTFIRKEKFVDIFIAEQGFFLEIFSCQKD